MSPKVFIIILNWNQWQLTEDCLISLRDIHYDNFQIIVIDNGSSPEQKDLMRNSSLRPFFILLENASNLGFAAGNNVGIRYALNQGADYALLLNNDTLTSDKDLLKKMVAVAEDNSNVGIVGPKIYYYQEDQKPAKIWFAGGKINWLKTKAWHLKNNEQGQARETDFVTGCCLLIKKEVINKIGLMPEEYFLYFEDADWSLRARRAGYKCLYLSTVWLWHKVSSSAVEFSDSYIYYHSRNGLLLGWRRGNWLTRPLVFLLSIFILFKQFLKLGFGHKKEWANPMIRGVRDFYKMILE